MKTDLQQTTFVCSVRIDTDERAKNVVAVYNFYKKHCYNYRSIFIEDSTESRIPGLLNLDENDIYIFKYNKGMYKRCEAFNQGLLLANTSKVVGFCDTDVIIDPNQIKDAINEIITKLNSGILYPYNGLFLCVSESVKEKFIQTLDYNDLKKHFPKQITLNNNDGNVLVGHTSSIGGFLLVNRKNFMSINGYNPNFIGWGYEDDEIAKRTHKMGFEVSRLKGSEIPLWHLPHDGDGASPKAENPFYKSNEVLLHNVINSDKDQLQKYINTWNLL